MRKTLLVVAFVIGFSGFIGVHTASAQAVDVFMLAPPILGDAHEINHNNWIDVVSLRQTLDQISLSGTGAQANGSANCQIEIVKFLDRAGPLLWTAAVTGHVFSEVQIDMTTKGIEGDRVNIYEIRLRNVQITSISTVTEGALPFEKVVLKAASATLSYIPPIRNSVPATSTITCSPDRGRAA